MTLLQDHPPRGTHRAPSGPSGPGRVGDDVARARRQDGDEGPGIDDDPVVAEDDVDELDDDLGGLAEDEDLEEDDGTDLPEGFSVVDADDGPPSDDEDPAVPARATAVEEDRERATDVLEAAARDRGVDDDEDDDLAVQRSGEFVCTRCHLVKRDTQLARPRLRICRDCA